MEYSVRFVTACVPVCSWYADWSMQRHPVSIVYTASVSDHHGTHLTTYPEFCAFLILDKSSTFHAAQGASVETNH